MNKIYKAILAVAAAAIVAGATMTPMAVNAWGDSAGGRPVYTLEQINAGELGDKITFNSITNGKIGDERNFVGAKMANSNSNTWNGNEIAVKDGDIVTIRLYVHNNSPKGEAAVAEGVSVSFSLPMTIGKTQTLVGYLNSTNATPTRYWDEVSLTSSEYFYIEYMDGSAKYTNAKLGTVSLPDEVIISGATIGYEALNGKIPGCYEYDGQVTINVKVHKVSASEFEKRVRIKGTKDWSETVDAKIGDEVEYRIDYKNLAGETVKDVVIRDALPTNMQYVAGSTKLYNSNHPSGITLSSDNITTSGVNIGDYEPEGNAAVVFTAKVISKTLECGDNKLVNWASVTVGSDVVKDDASVMVERDDLLCHKPDLPDQPDKPTPDDPEEPEDPTPDDPKEPEEPAPKEIVDTGANGIVGAALGAGSMVTAAGYFIASRKKLM